MTRSGWRTAILSAIAAPIEMPPTTKRSTPRQSAKASTSSANVAIESSPTSPADDRPWPRHSSVRRRYPSPSGNTSATCASSPPSPCWKTTGSPAPSIAAPQGDAVTLERRTSSCGGFLGDHAAQEGGNRRRLRLRSAHGSTSGPSKPAARRLRTKCRKSMTPEPAAAKLPSARRSLACAMTMRSPSMSTACGDDRAGFDRGGRLEQICRIEHDPDARRAEAVDQLPRQLGRRDDVGQLRLDAEVDAALLGERSGLGHLDEQVVPGLGACIVRMMRPLIGRVARAGAQRDQPRAHQRRRADQRGEAGEAVGADRGIGMDHVVGARHARRSQRRTRRLAAAISVALGRGDRFRHGRRRPAPPC